MLEELIRQETQIPPPVLVPTPEWPSVDRRVYARRGTPQDVADFWEWFGRTAKEGDAMAPFGAVWFACEADGKTPVFARESARWLKDEGAGPTVARIFTAVDRLNLLTEAAREDLRKNWESGECGPTCSSPSPAAAPDAGNSTSEQP